MSWRIFWIVLSLGFLILNPLHALWDPNSYSHCPESQEGLLPRKPKNPPGISVIYLYMIAWPENWEEDPWFNRFFYPGAQAQIVSPSGRSAGFNPEWHREIPPPPYRERFPSEITTSIRGIGDCGTLGVASYSILLDQIQGDDETDEPDPYPLPDGYQIEAYGLTERGWYTIRIYGRPFTPGARYFYYLTVARWKTSTTPGSSVEITVPHHKPPDRAPPPTHPAFIPIGPTEVHSYQFYLDPDAFPHPVTLYRMIPIIVKPPGEGPKPIQPSSPGKTPIAILSQGRFSAPEEVEISSLRAGKTGTENSLAFCHPDGEDVNQDGKKDLVCQFFTEKLNLSPGDRELIVTGKTRAPRDYEFRATYPIRIVPPGKP